MPEIMIQFCIIGEFFKIHCGLVTPYGDKDLCQHWLRSWLVAWRHQAITWTNVDLSSVRSNDIHLTAISQEITQQSIIEISLQITHLKFHSNVPGANELRDTKMNVEFSIIVLTEMVQVAILHYGRRGSIYPTINSIAAHDLATQGARSSAAMLLT